MSAALSDFERERLMKILARADRAITSAMYHAADWQAESEARDARGDVRIALRILSGESMGPVAPGAAR